MAKEVKGARFVLKRSIQEGYVPTVPPNDDHTSGLWTDTDIYKGEMFLNMVDGKMWFRNENDVMIQYVELTSGGTIDESYLPGNYIGAMVYQGTWDASTGNPPSTTPSKGDYWIVSVAGNTDLDGITDWEIGDFAIFNDPSWDKIDNSEPNIYASSVIYSFVDYGYIDNAEEALDLLLEEHVVYSSGTNINIAGTKHAKTVSVIDSPIFAGNIKAVGMTSSNGLTVSSGDLTVTTGNLTVDGTSTLGGNVGVTGTLTTTSNISTTGVGDLTANTIQARSGRYNLNTTSSYILGDGGGVYLYYLGGIKLNVTGSLTTTYNKLTYNSVKTITSNQDIVDKGWVDSTIALHNTGLWTSGGVYEILAWDGGINTHKVGINVSSPSSTLDVGGPGSFKVHNYGDRLINIDATTGLVRIGDMDGAYSENYLEMLTGTNATLTYYGSNGLNVFSIDGDGNTVVKGSLMLNGSNTTINCGGITSSGSITSTSTIVSSGSFRTTSTSAVFGTASAGTVYLRPNGYTSATDQSTFTTSTATIGTNMTVSGSITSSTITSTGSIIGDTYFRSSDDTVVVGTASSGSILLRPTVYTSSVDQSSFTASLASIGTNMVVSGSLTATGTITSSGTFSSSVGVSSVILKPATAGGTVFLQPHGTGPGQTTQRSSFTSSLASIGTNTVIDGSITADYMYMLNTGSTWSIPFLVESSSYAGSYIRIEEAGTGGSSLQIKIEPSSGDAGDVCILGASYVRTKYGIFHNNSNVIQSYIRGNGTSYFLGDVAIGKSTAASKLDVSESVLGGTVVTLENTDTGSSSSASDSSVLDIRQSSGYYDYEFIHFYKQGTFEGSIRWNTSGDIGFGQSSDEQLKKNIEKTKIDSLSILNQIEIVDYNWKDEKRNPQAGKLHGIVAQQVEKILPSMVGETHGNKTISYAGMNPHYIKAIQQLTDKNTELENRIKELENKIIK